MKCPMSPLQSLLALAAGLTLAAAAPGAEPAGRPVALASLSTNSVAVKMVGSWTLDRSLSQVPGPPAGGPRGGGSLGSPGIGMGGPPPGGPGGATGGPPEGGVEGGRSERGGPPPRPEGMGGTRTMTIELDDLDIRITSGSGRVRVITPGGEAVERARGPMLVTETARWEGERLVIESVADDGPITTEMFAFSEDGSDRLVHTMSMPRPDSDEQEKAVLVYERSTTAK